jgi:hypothetical protein
MNRRSPLAHGPESGVATPILVAIRQPLPYDNRTLRSRLRFRVAPTLSSIVELFDVVVPGNMVAIHFKPHFFFDVLRCRRRSDDASASRLERPPYRDPHHIEYRLLSDRELPWASHLVTPRRGYLHHGIYVGNGQVVHYTGLAHGLRRGPVEEVPLSCFTRDHPVWVISNGPSTFDGFEIIRRARSRVGEDSYRLLSNNCEHFCEWCLHGENRSYQVEAWLAHPARALLGMLRIDGQCQRLRGSD